MIYVKTALLGGALFAAAVFAPELTGLSASHDVLEAFLGLFGSFYAIIMGFVVYMATESYRNVRALIAAEVNALQDVRDFLLLVDHDPATVSAIRSDLAAYVRAICAREWPIMMRGRETSAEFRDTPPEVLQLLRHVKVLRVNGPSEQIAMDQVVDAVARITTVRTDRLSAAAQRLPRALHSLIVWMSLLAIATFSLLDVADPRMDLFLNGVNVFSITFLYFIIADLNDPFHGTWRIDVSEYRELLSRLATQEP